MKFTVLKICLPLMFFQLTSAIPGAIAIASPLVAPPVVVAAEEEDFDTAFRNRSIPWFDTEANEIKSMQPPQQVESGVGDRHGVPLKKLKKKGQQVIKAKKVAAPGAAGGATGSFSGIGEGFVYTAGAVLLAALVGLMLYGFLKLESGGKDLAGEDPKRKRKIKDHIKHLPFDLEEQEGDFESAAQQAFNRGDYSSSVIYLFADLLVAMSEADVIRLQRGKTNRQYLNEIWDCEQISPYYRQVMTCFEDAFFGKHEISKSRAEECFAGRVHFDAAVEKIGQQKFADAAAKPVLLTASVPAGATL